MKYTFWNLLQIIIERLLHIIVQNTILSTVSREEVHKESANVRLTKIQCDIIQIIMNQLNQSENNILQQLQSLTNCTWQDQVQIINSLKITPHLVKMINIRNYSSEIASLFAAFSPKSKLITTLTDFLIELFSNYADQLISFANILVTNECLIRLLGSGNKVVSSSVNQALKCIISNTNFKMRARSIKYVNCLEYQFLNSKNNYVRQKISLYFIYIATSYYYGSKESLITFQRRIVKVGLSDANQKVRKNMKEILQNLHHFQKQNSLTLVQSELQKKNETRVIMSNKNVNKVLDNKSSKVLNSSINQSSVLQNFQQQLKKQPIQQTSSENDYTFYLERLKSGNTWPMILLSYQNILSLIKNGILRNLNNQNIYVLTLTSLMPFLIEKRNKMFDSCSAIFDQILEDVKVNNRTKVISFCQQNIAQLVDNIIKHQNVALRVMPKLITLSPTFFIPKLVQISPNLKNLKQKILTLDIILNNIELLFENISNKTIKKIGSIVTNICLHLQNSIYKQKQLSLAAMAIISQLKSKYPQEVLTALLCQPDKILSKIIELAQSIDESLKTAVINYINSLKGPKKCNKPSKQSNIYDLLNKELLLISQHKVSSLNRLGELTLTHIQQITTKDFKKIISILQFLCTNDLIMEYKILMTQICKTSNRRFIIALLQVIVHEEMQANEKYRQYHDILLLQVLSVFVNNYKEKNDSISTQICISLIKIYRESQSLKKRNVVIETLINIDENCLKQNLSQKQLNLVNTYASRLESQFSQI